jgi:hypothetical protein
VRAALAMLIKWERKEVEEGDKDIWESKRESLTSERELGVLFEEKRYRYVEMVDERGEEYEKALTVLGFVNLYEGLPFAFKDVTQKGPMSPSVLKPSLWEKGIHSDFGYDLRI